MVIMDHISLVVIHYNTEAETVACLRSLSQINTRGFKLQILILDNASKTPLVLPPSLQTNEFEVLRSESNLGFTGGNNLLIKYAIEKYDSDYVVLLNNDTVVDVDFLQAMYADIRKRPQVGFLTPKIYFAAGYEFHQQSYEQKDKGKVLWYAGGSIDWRNLIAFHRGVDELDRGQFDGQTQSDFATGCCILIPRRVLETVGLFDERYFLYLEDVDWSIRVAAAGYEIGFCPTSVVWHKNAGSSGGPGSPTHRYYQTRNRVWLAWRYGRLRTKLTALRHGLDLFLHGTAPEKQAMLDLLTGQLGKRAVISE